jgi:hypothetical protein
MSQNVQLEYENKQITIQATITGISYDVIVYLLMYLYFLIMIILRLSLSVMYDLEQSTKMDNK